MFTLSVENQYGNSLQLTQNSNYDVLSVTGLTPASATINMDTVAMSDGTAFNSSRVNNRNIVITLGYRGSVEANRIALYQFFRPKQYVKLYYSNDNRDVWIEGYVETFEGNLFELGQKAQISIICPNPYFKDVNDITTDFMAVTNLLEFPVEFPEAGIEFSSIQQYYEEDIVNQGDVEAGVIIKIITNGVVENPTFYNLTTSEQFGIEIETQTGDVIVINTNSGEKGITLTRNGVTQNIINKVVRGSNWFTLLPGDNLFSYVAESGVSNMSVIFYTTTLYEGV